MFKFEAKASENKLWPEMCLLNGQSLNSDGSCPSTSYYNFTKYIPQDILTSSDEGIQEYITQQAQDAGWLD